MKSEVVSIMLNGCTTLIWLIPAAGIIKARKIDEIAFLSVSGYFHYNTGYKYCSKK